MQHLDEGTIHAWLDGELPPAEAEALEAHVAACDECKAAVAEARGFIAASSRILTALDAVPRGVLPASASTTTAKLRAPRRFTISRAWMAAAALLVLSTATVIAVRPRREAAALRVAEVNSKTEAASPMAAAPAEKLQANEPASPRADEIAAPTQQSTDKLSKREESAKKDSRFAAGDSARAPMMVAEAARAREPERQALSAAKAPAPAAPAADNAGASGSYAAPMVAQAPAPAPVPSRVGDSLAARRMALNSIAVSGAGAPSSAQRLKVSAALDSPVVVSRSTTNSGTDTVVTTIYRVGGVPVTLIDRSPVLGEMRFEGKLAPKAQPGGKTRDTTIVFNSLTWSDSTGRTRTLRGTVSTVELERIKAALFGATP